MKEFLDKYKVLILGGLAAVAVAIQQFFIAPEVDYKAVAFAAVIAVVSYIGRNLRGQWQTILLVVGSAIANIFTAYTEGGHVSTQQIIATVLAAIASLGIPAPKSKEYENTEVIKEAKAEAKEIDASKVPPVDPPVGK